MFCYCSDMEKEKSALLDAISRKGVVLCECLERKQPADVLPMATLANVQDLMNSALELADPTDSKVGRRRDGCGSWPVTPGYISSEQNSS